MHRIDMKARTPILALALALTATTGSAQVQATRLGGQTAAPSAPVRVNDPVVIVDASGAGHFLTVGTALQSVQRDTLILVRHGDYGGPNVVDTPGITVQADEGAHVRLLGGIEVRQIGAGKSVVVSGLTLLDGLTVEDCAGSIRFDGCTVPAPLLQAGPPPSSMYWQWSQCGFGLSRQTVSRCDQVTFVDCVFHGADGARQWEDGAPGQHGLLVEESNVALYRSFLFGGEGAAAVSPGHYPVTSGAGGDGLRVVGAGSTVRTCDLAAVGGLGGTFAPGGNGSFGVTFGCDGIDVRTDPGSNTDACPVDDLAFMIPALARAGVPPTYQIAAPPGSPVFLMISASQDWRTFTPASGILHLPSSATVVSLGVMPSGGLLSRPFPAPAPAYLLGHIQVELQAYAIIGGVDRYSEPRTLVVVDPSL